MSSGTAPRDPFMPSRGHPVPAGGNRPCPIPRQLNILSTGAANAGQRHGANRPVYAQPGAPGTRSHVDTI
jgi:hypothetical protein